MGDVALTVPVILSVSQHYKELKIIVLTKNTFLPFFQNIKNVSVTAVNLNEYKGLLGIFRLFLTMKKLGPYEKIIDLHNSLRSKLLSFFFYLSQQIPVSFLKKDRKIRYEQTKQKNKILFQLPHITQKYMSVFEKVNLSAPLVKQGPWIKTNTKTKQQAKQILRNLVVKEKYRIGYAPFASHSLKEFSYQKKQSLITYLLKNMPNCSLFLFGSPNDKDTMKQLTKNLSNVFIVSEIASSLEIELGVMEHMNLILSMDSGNLHLAALLNRPVIGIYGTTHPYSGFYPFRQKENVIQQNLDCRPCSIYGNTHCIKKNVECLESISNETILNKVLSTLKTK